MMNITMTNKQRFLAKVRKTTTCWLWTGAGHASGAYGFFNLNGRSRGAHVAALMLFKGYVPGKAHVLHTCDVKLCVRPSHLYVGTHAQNMHDARARQRHPRGDANSSRKYPERLARGVTHGRSKLTDADVVKIWHLRASGLSFAKIAAHFDVWPSTVHMIIRGRTWPHVQVVV